MSLDWQKEIKTTKDIADIWGMTWDNTISWVPVGVAQTLQNELNEANIAVKDTWEKMEQLQKELTDCKEAIKCLENGVKDECRRYNMAQEEIHELKQDLTHAVTHKQEAEAKIEAANKIIQHTCEQECFDTINTGHTYHNCDKKCELFQIRAVLAPNTEKEKTK